MQKLTKKTASKTAERSVENEIVEALADFTEALKNGKVLGRFTCRHIQLKLEPTAYSLKLVKETRKILGVSQLLFARFLGVSPKTVRAREQGVNTPHPMVCRFMDEIRHTPDRWIGRLRKLTVVKNSSV